MNEQDTTHGRNRTSGNKETIVKKTLKIVINEGGDYCEEGTASGWWLRGDITSSDSYVAPISNIEHRYTA